MEPKKYLSDLQVMSALGVKSRNTLLALRRNDPSFPKPVTFSRKYRKTDAEELAAWMANRPKLAI